MFIFHFMELVSNLSMFGDGLCGSIGFRHFLNESIGHVGLVATIGTTTVGPYLPCRKIACVSAQLMWFCSHVKPTQNKVCVVLSCIVLSCLVLPCLVLSCLKSQSLQLPLQSQCPPDLGLLMSSSDLTTWQGTRTVTSAMAARWHMPHWKCVPYYRPVSQMRANLGACCERPLNYDTLPRLLYVFGHKT